ncbi:Aspartyl/Asparaginyl beta-hydroxylase [Tenacibaculum sp. MAR_2009_124]|uniref:aspartyl/asparaginyl beta-hydroxylase domain-containing protein n=1 Tax=Tenacibaculum sp. MAR_2009_124 TaxID=1250059 RepID=UPI0008942B24|nr:aspartyl/asparaginyl beta-hydroxylase domain-containing protein [Tenacibaculum sp. MAR_2009_124]SEB40578.1 Aspartyl/Asparaginyl beta-hydroxylase [Tenacibaculum sp. MAR_2009_124]
MDEKEGVKFLKLPFKFHAEKLSKDLDKIEELNWSNHFNKNGYSGIWSSVALFSVDGELNNISVPLDGQKLLETKALNVSNYFSEVLAVFKAPILSARLLKLKSGSEIKPHEDHNLGYEDGCFRIHIPIITDEKVNFFIEDKRINMLPGECWYTNVNYTHSVSNFSKIDRVHIVIDLERNEWSDSVFFSLCKKEQLLLKPTINYNLETIKKMISELKLQNTETSKQLIESLKKQYQL